MPRPSACCIVFVTAPDKKTALRLARGALEGHLVACANLAGGVESHYWWKGKLEKSKEILIIFKTIYDQLRALESFIYAHHPYDTPEFLVVRIAAGSKRYLRWVQESVAGSP